MFFERLLALSFVKLLFCAGRIKFRFSSCCAFCCAFRFGGTQNRQKEKRKRGTNMIIFLLIKYLRLKKKFEELSREWLNTDLYRLPTSSYVFVWNCRE